jgi:ethanolamine ammonia-lyase small subunit
MSRSSPLRFETACQCLQTKRTLLLTGEAPRLQRCGLLTVRSMAAYLTWKPAKEGLSTQAARFGLGFTTTSQTNY